MASISTERHADRRRPKAMMMKSTATAIFVLLLLTGCGATATDGGSPPPGTTGPRPDTGAPSSGEFDGEWRLLSGQGPSGKVPIPRQVTLVVDGQTISGIAACNNYFGDAQIDGESFEVSGLGSTEMGCPGKRAVAEQRYLEALDAARSIVREADELHLGGESVDLRFELVPPPEPAAFEDTQWELESLVFGAGADGTVSSTEAPGHIVFASDGTLSGHTGCQPLKGQWQQDGDIVTVTGLPEGTVDCQVAGGQNDHLMTVLASPFTAEADVRRLTIQQADGDLGMDYRAE